MKVLYLTVLSLVLSMTLRAQVGIGTQQPNARAVLDLKSPSNNQGFRAPRLSTSQRTAQAFTANLSTSENGRLVFDTDDLLFYYWMFPQWNALEAGTSRTIPTTGSGAPVAAAGEQGAV